MISFSTAWEPKPRASLKQTLHAAREMGFTSFEIGISSARFRPGFLKKLVEKRQIQIVSLHNVRSRGRVDSANSRGDWLSALDEKRRRAAVEMTIETCQHAEVLGARAVVLHLGAVGVAGGSENVRRMCQYGAEHREQPQYEQLLREILEARQAKAPPFFEAAKRSLAEICERTGGVTLGVETRYGYHEIPDFAEAEELFEEFQPPRVGYWHDTGHAHVQEYIGLRRQEEWLRRFGSRLVGLHLHDAQGPGDHHPPGIGEIDFSGIRTLVQPGAIQVMEILGDHTAAGIIAGRQHLYEAGFE